MLVRKHEWESTTKKATSRSWDKVYVVLSGRSLEVYKDQKHAKSEPKAYYHGEQPASLEGAVSNVATDYQKRPYVFRLKLENGAEYLFQGKDDDDMNSWISKINSVAGADAATASGRAQTLPAQGQKEESKRRSFFTLKKK